VKGDPRNPKSNVILAPRGGGKTAQKVMLEEYAESEANQPFYCVTYDSFRTIPRSRLGTLNTDWHLIFHISHQAARNKIQNMMAVGAVVKSGEIENPGNRPLHQYSVVDPRLACVVMSSYSIKDILTFFCFICPRCHVVLAREGSEAMCHECSLEFGLDDDESVLANCPPV
jgi:hypothetical protein